MVADLEGKGGEIAFVESQVPAVDPHVRRVVDPLEDQGRHPVPDLGRHLESSPEPDRAGQVMTLREPVGGHLHLQPVPIVDLPGVEAGGAQAARQGPPGAPEALLQRHLAEARAIRRRRRCGAGREGEDQEEA